jgi:DNA-directed RNA polymerase subunit RPC12/RpoP
MVKDIHKIDNYLIRVGIVWLFLLVGYGACSGGIGNIMFSCASDDQKVFHVSTGSNVEIFLSERTLEEVQASYPRSDVNVYEPGEIEPFFEGVHPVYLWTPWLLLFIGYIIRREENKVIAVWNIIERSGEISLSDLSTNTGHSRDFLLKAVQLINKHSKHPYHWDQHYNIIYNTSTAGQIFYVEKCANCQASVGQNFRVSKIKAATCPYCQFALITNDMLEHAKAVKESNVFKAPSDVSEVSPFNPIVFFVLLVIFSPLAIGYAIWKTGLLKKWSHATLQLNQLDTHAGNQRVDPFVNEVTGQVPTIPDDKPDQG